MNISVVGLGKLGFPMAIAIAKMGHQVVGVDVDERRVASIAKGTSPISEPGMDGLLKEALASRRFQITTDYQTAVGNSSISIIAVNTPDGPDGNMDLSQIRESSQAIGNALRNKRDFHIVAVSSTILPGTTTDLVRPTLEQYSGKRCGEDFGVCASPVFIALATVVRDFLNPPVVVLGEGDERVGKTMADFYAGLCQNKPQILRTTPLTAELIKMTHNAFATCKMAFINEIGVLCSRLSGADVRAITKFFQHGGERAGKFLTAGLGFGGPCFPRDLKFFLSYSETMGYRPTLIRAVGESNVRHTHEIIRLIEESSGELKGRVTAILGLAYKPGVDIIENSFSLVLTKLIQEKGASVRVYDPMAMRNCREVLGNGFVYASSAIEALRGAELCILTTPWKEFKELKSADFKAQMKRSLVFDPWGLFDADSFAEDLDGYVRLGDGQLANNIGRRYGEKALHSSPIFLP